MNNFVLSVLVLWSLYATFRWYCNYNDRDFFNRRYKAVKQDMQSYKRESVTYRIIAEQAFKELRSALNRLSRKRNKNT